MRRLILYFFLFYTGIISAQSVLVKGKIIDENTKEPVPYAAILLKGTSSSTVSNAEGNFQLYSKNKTTTLIIYRLGYFTKEIRVENYENAIIALKSKVTNLGEVDVVSKKIDTLQYKTKTICTAFEFYDNYIVALVNKGRSINYIQLMEDDGTIVKEKRAPLGVEYLFKDCFGNVQLVSKDSTWQFYYDYEKLYFMKPYSVAEFAAKVVPCQCTVKDLVYFKEERFKSLKHLYYYVNLKDPEKRHKIDELMDESAISAIRKYEDLAYFIALRNASVGGTGDVQYGTSVTELSDHLDEIREQAPLHPKLAGTIYPIQTEMVKKDSALFVIDYFNKRIKKYNLLGGLLKTDSITVPYLKPAALQDAEGNKFYLVKEESGISNLYEYNEYKQDLKQIQMKEFKFLKNLRCRNNVAYFIFRDPISPNNGWKIYKYRL